MANKEYNIEILDAPTEKDLDNESKNSWLYEKTGIAINDFDKDDKAKKDFVKEEEYKKYWDSLTDGEKFAKTRDATELAGRPLTMTVDEWNELPAWKKSWHTMSKIGVPGVPGAGGYDNPIYKGVVIGSQNALTNAFSLPLEITDALGATDGATEAFAEVIASMDPLKPENSAEAITAVLAQYGIPSIVVANWMSKFKRAPGFWKAMKKYALTIGAVGVTDMVVSGPGDINLATAFGDNWMVPMESFLTIHEDDPSLVKRVKIGAEMVWVGPLVDTLLMTAGGIFKGGRFLLGGADPKKKIEYIDLNGNKQEFWTTERTFNAVAKIINDWSGPRSLEEIEETLKLFQGSGIIPPTGAASGSEGLIHLQKLFNVGGYSDVTVKNLLSMNENIDALLKANGLSDGINSLFLTTKVRNLQADINAKIASKQETLANIKLEQKGAVSEAKATLKENEIILQRELTELKEQRKVIQTEIKENFTNEFNAAKDEVLSYIKKVGQYDPGTSNQLSHSLDEELINQFAYLTYYKNQLYKNIDVNPTTKIKIEHDIKNFKIKDTKDTVFSLLKKDINNFTKKKDSYDVVAKRIPKELTDELKTLINPKNKGALTLSRLEELRSSFTKAYKDAIDANDTVLADRIITSKRQIFDNLYDNITKVADPEYAGMAERAQLASDWFKNEYAPRFQEGVGSMWAEALKKRKSGSLGSSSPEQSPLYFLKNDGNGLYINNSSEAGINQIENILNPPKDELGELLTHKLIDPYTNKPLNVADKANADKIVENFFAAKIAQALHGKTDIANSLTILERFEDAYYPILQKYPKIANQIEEYKTTLKEKNAKVLNTDKAQKSSELAEKEITLNQVNQKKDLIEESKIKDQRNVDAINASFSEKIDIASEELKLLSNERNNNVNLFSFFVNDSPANTIGNAMNDADPVAAISTLRAEVNAFNIPELSKGFDESISQWLKSQIDTKIKIPKTANIKYKGFKYGASLEGLDDILSNPQKVQALEAAGWSADDIATLGKFSEQLTILERSNLTAKGASKAEITDPAQVGRKAQILAASIYGIVKGRGIMAIMNLIGGALGISPMKAQSLLIQEAMTHPDLATILLMKDSEESIKLLNGYVINNYLSSGNAREEFKEKDIQYNIEEIQDYNIEPISRSFVPDSVDVNVPDVNRESRLAKNFIQPVNNMAALPNQTVAAALPNQGQRTGPVDPGRAAFAFGPNDILAQQRPRYAAQGGIMSTNKAFQRVA